MQPHRARLLWRGSTRVRLHCTAGSYQLWTGRVRRVVDRDRGDPLWQSPWETLEVQWDVYTSALEAEVTCVCPWEVEAPR